MIYNVNYVFVYSIISHALKNFHMFYLWNVSILSVLYTHHVQEIPPELLQTWRQCVNLILVVLWSVMKQLCTMDQHLNIIKKLLFFLKAYRNSSHAQHNENYIFQYSALFLFYHNIIQWLVYFNYLEWHTFFSFTDIFNVMKQPQNK